MEFTFNTTDTVKRFETAENFQNGVTFFTLRVEYEEIVQPAGLEIRFSFPMRDVNGVWTPLGSETTEVLPDWRRRSASSAIASGLPLLVGFGAKGENRFAMALSDVKCPCSLSCGVTEENGEASVSLKLFTSLVSPLDRYEVILRLDERPLSFARAVQSVRVWWEKDIGWHPCPVPDASRRPVYSTWYNFHHAMAPGEMLEELKIAKPLGCDTIMIDGGWYHESTQRGASDSGDWIPAPGKVGEGRSFTDACHALGVKVVYWFGVPFVGKNAGNHDRFIGKYLYDTDGVIGASILDPRFADVREFIIGECMKVVKNQGLDGVKFDFVDLFRLEPTSPKNYEDMDIPILEDAVDALMSALYRMLTEIDPEMIIEFRQSYIGPAIRAFGNILRVGDCPYSGRTNARCVCDLRLTSGQTAVHTDMSMWEKGTSVTDAARQLWMGVFAVPQISVMLRKLPEDHLTVVRRFLSYWMENRELLLDGDFECAAPLGTYAWMASSTEKREVRLLITERTVIPSRDVLDIVNVTGDDRLYLDLTEEADPVQAAVTDCFGEVILRETLQGGMLHRLTVPDASVLRVERRTINFYRTDCLTHYEAIVTDTCN